MTWAKGPWLGLDFESTGVDPATARIVTACCAYRSESDSGWTQSWLGDAGGEVIPDGAIAIHGVTTERAHAEGRPAGEIAVEIHTILHEAWAGGIPVVCYNAPYDLTLLHAELQRAGHPGLILGGPVLDPLVMDRALDKFRKGKRTLTATCAHYGVRLSSAAPGEDESTAAGAHDSTADTLAALRVLWCIGRKYGDIAAKPLSELQDLQVEWQRAWAENFTAYRRRSNPDAEEIASDWPYVALDRAAVLS
jgi:DNA polymerase-3 subunit epsilon